jgi:hypothetical protein
MGIMGFSFKYSNKTKIEEWCQLKSSTKLEAKMLVETAAMLWLARYEIPSAAIWSIASVLACGYQRPITLSSATDICAFQRV